MIFGFKQKTAYDMRISYCSSDVCASDLFEDIQRFVKENGRLPQHGEDRDIFERLYAVRLERMRVLPEARELLARMDSEGILDAAEPVGKVSSELDDSALLAELGLEQDAEDDITKLRHVSSRAEKRAAEEIANREKCDDFEEFRPLCGGIEADLKGGLRQAKPLGNSEATLAEIQPGNF